MHPTMYTEMARQHRAELTAEAEIHRLARRQRRTLRSARSLRFTRAVISPTLHPARL
jgi:hypothetical protein